MKAFYCAGTHWDREWCKPFQEYRMWLVELIDELMDLMDSDTAYKCFHLDGQTIVLEDYLEIRPERRDRLMRFLKERRLLAGPWYNLPDEWLVSGESLIRNLLRGSRICREMGFDPLDFAYTPDQFGHIAALPMIAHGFGLKAGICWRGTQDEHYPAQFVWVGPDGSRMVYHKLMDKGSYEPFRFSARLAIKDAGFSDASFRDFFEPYFNEEIARAPLPVVLMLDAVDHQRPDPEMPRLFSELQKRYPEIEFVWGTLDEYAREIAPHAAELPERRGELREPLRDAHRGGQYLIVHTLSSRYPLKKRNDECQALLELWAEPYTLFAQISNAQTIVQYLYKSWEYLLKNHPHDSICGCSIDQVHRDMHYRFDQSRQIADGIVRRALACIGMASDAPEDWANIVVHNPLPYRRKGVYELALYFPPDFGARTGFIYQDGLVTGERYNKFHLVRADGARLAYQLRSIDRNRECLRLNAIGRETCHVGDVYHVAVELELPACGYTSFQVLGTHDATRTFGSLRTGPLSASNGVIEFRLMPDGTGTLLDAVSGRAFEGLFLYEDAGECGDGWTRGIPVRDMVYRGPGTRVLTAVEEDGPLRTVFRVERELVLPCEIDRRTFRRSEAHTSLWVTDHIAVEKHAPFLRVRTTLTNTIRDHRLRVLFPTHVAAEQSFAETPFAVVERDIQIPEESAYWQERVNPEKAFTGFFGVQDGQGGLTILAPFGLHEYEVTQTPEHSLALTLFRAYFKTVMKPEEQDGELLEEMSFEYLLLPFAGPFDLVQASRLLAEARAGIRTHECHTLPTEHSFLTLEQGVVVVTAIKPAENGNGGIIRLWNPTGEERNDRILLTKRVEDAVACNLKEAPVAKVAYEAEGGIPVSVPAGGLTTIRFNW